MRACCRRPLDPRGILIRAKFIEWNQRPRIGLHWNGPDGKLMRNWLWRAVLRAAGARAATRFPERPAKWRLSLDRRETRIAALKNLLKERIVILDGAMGTMIQAQQLDEADFRGTQFAHHPRDLRGNYDVLNITQPQIMEAIQRAVSRSRRGHHQDQYVQLQRHFRARLRPRKPRPRAEFRRRARSRARSPTNSQPRIPAGYCFVAGSMGPTNRTASMSQDVNNPASRGVTFDQLREVYYEQARGLVEGGVDLLLLETFSTR